MELVGTLEGHEDRVWHVSWDPQGTYLASCSGDKTVKIWRPLWKRKVVDEEEKGITSNSNDYAATATITSNINVNEKNNNIMMNETNDKEREVNYELRWILVSTLEDGHERTIRSCEWSPDGRFLSSVSFDATCVLWECSRRSLNQNENELERETNDDEKIYTELLDWDLVSSREGHENEVKSVAWNVSGTLLATSGRDKTIWIWETISDQDVECLDVLHGHSQDIKFIRWHPYEDVLYSCSYDDSIKIWEEGDENWECTKTLIGHEATVWNLSFNGSGNQFISAGDNNRIILWEQDPDRKNIEALGKVDTFHDGSVYSIDWKKNFKNEKAEAKTRTITITNVNGEECEICSDMICASGGGDNTINIFVPIQNKTSSSSGKDRSSIVINNSNNKIDNEVNEEEMTGNEEDLVIENKYNFTLLLAMKQAHTADVNCVRWNPTRLTNDPFPSSYLASAGDDGVIRIWKFTPEHL